ncbi:MAG: SDR family oxidoreductase [Deltaproteobacteria bacterium]|nr:MAG: SDR family oxidoreductase [Deltaproteobacteria bacterium]
MARVLVTGAGRGLGLAFVQNALQQGDRVFACVRKPERSEALQELAKQHTEQLTLVKLEVTSSEEAEAAFHAVSQHVKGLDLLINNAGINSMSQGKDKAGPTLRLNELEAEPMLWMFHVNSIAPVMVARQFLPLLEKGDNPAVLNVSSWLGSISGKSRGGNYGYCASKTTLNMMMRAFAFDVKEQGVRVYLFNPGWVQTDMGGSKASLTPEESTASMRQTLDQLTLEQTGEFFDWNGSPHAW